MSDFLLRYANPVLLWIGIETFAAAGLGFHFLVIRRFRTAHQVLWRALGAPGFWPGKSNLKLEQFLAVRNVNEHLNDPALSDLLFGRRLAVAVASGLTVLFVVVLFVGLTAAA